MILRFMAYPFRPKGHLVDGLLKPTTFNRQKQSHASRFGIRLLSQKAAAAYPILSFPAPFLRAYDSSNFDAATFQRNDVVYDEVSGKPRVHRRSDNEKDTSHDLHKIIDCSEIESGFKIKWGDGKESFYPKDWVEKQLQLWQKSDASRILWTGLDESKVRQSSDLCMPYHEILIDQGMKKALQSLYRYGILLITDTPINDDGAGIAAMGAAFSGGAVKNQLSIYKAYKEGKRDLVLPYGTDGPLRTLYGTVWSTSSASQVEGSSRADSAYGTSGLPLHTDMTYHRDPPGLQIFTMVHPSGQGGESVFGDGFAAAERLRSRDPSAFNTLSSTIRRYRSCDADTGWHLEATGPVIQTDSAGNVVAIRHNDLDRLPDLPPSHMLKDKAAVAYFYQELEYAHSVWDSILAEDDIRLVMPLKAGETMVVVNQRCFHGRFGFHTLASEKPRSVMGCYVSQDELNSRFRMEGFVVP